MSIRKYFIKSDSDLSSVLPSSSSGYSFLNKKDLEQANHKVLQSALEDKPPRGQYNSYTPEERAQIGKYATENGNIGAAKHFSKALDRKISESTVRRFKTNYLHAVAEARSTTAAEPIVNSLPTKVQGRPLLLGLKIDKAIQEYVEATRGAGGVINIAIVMAAAVGIVSSRNITALRSHGGYIEITKPWAQSLLKRMGYVRRKCCNAGKVSPLHFIEIKETFLADIQVNGRPI